MIQHRFGMIMLSTKMSQSTKELTVKWLIEKSMAADSVQMQSGFHILIKYPPLSSGYALGFGWLIIDHKSQATMQLSFIYTPAVTYNIMVSGTTGSCRAVCMKVHVAQIKPCGRLTMLPQSNKRSGKSTAGSHQ